MPAPVVERTGRARSLTWVPVAPAGRRGSSAAGRAGVTGRDSEHVAARDGERPGREPGRVDSWQAGRELDCGLPVGELVPDPDNLPWLASALHQTAVVHGEHGEPGLVEALCEQVGAGL